MRFKIGVFLALTLTPMFCFSAYGDMGFLQYEEIEYHRAIVGEAADQGKIGMEAVACGIINRGYSLRGVYGRSNGLYDREPQWVKDRAAKAWNWALSNPSGCLELIKGADHWENVKAYGAPWWAPHKTKVVLIKDHQFYK